MTNIINNVDMEKIRNTAENGRKDIQSLKKPVKLEGEWNLFDLDKGYQFRTELSYEKGKEVIEIDSPSFLGGNGNRLGPMAYCIAGITSCFAEWELYLSIFELPLLPEIRPYPYLSLYLPFLLRA